MLKWVAMKDYRNTFKERRSIEKAKGEGIRWRCRWTLNLLGLPPKEEVKTEFSSVLTLLVIHVLEFPGIQFHANKLALKEKQCG